MKAKYAVWVAFFLNLTYAIVEFIAGGVFGSSAVLADSVHDLGDADCNWNISFSRNNLQS